MSGEQTKLDKINARIESGRIIEQKSWKFIKELNSYSEERLNAVALIEDGKEITYRQMFRKWERYAETFTALGITGGGQARVGLVPEASASSVYALYGLNMVGASVSMLSALQLMDGKRLRKTVEKEGLTDLILSDMYVMPEMLQRLMKQKEALGLRHIILIHTPMECEFTPRQMQEFFKRNPSHLRRVHGALFMEDLLERYEATPFSPVTRSEEAAILLHTSGTTSGIPKPVPMSDRGFNESAARLLRDERFASYRGTLVSAASMELAGGYGACDQLHLPLAFGGTVLLLPLGGYNPGIYGFMAKYKANLLFTGTYLMNTLPKDPKKAPDLSGLSGIFVGGNAISAEVKKRFDETLAKFGAPVKSAVGYGLTEIGGACILSTPEREDGSIGYPLPGVKVRLFDEEAGAFFDLSDGPRVGTLYLSSPSLSSGRIGDRVIFELEEIDGEKYYNTNDLVSADADGCLFYLGRTDKYFVNNEGVRFDAGLVETAVGAEPGIVACGLAPEMNKIIHDTIPVLYVQTEGDSREAASVVRKALVGVFVRDNMIAQSNLPSQAVIVGELPFTSAGKVDTQALIQGNVTGKRYMVQPIHLQGKLKDIQLIPVKAAASSQMAIGFPEELRQPEFMKVFKPFMEKKGLASQDAAGDANAEAGDRRSATSGSRWNAEGKPFGKCSDRFRQAREAYEASGMPEAFERYRAHRAAVMKKRLELTAEYLKKMSDTMGPQEEPIEADAADAPSDAAPKTDRRTKMQQKAKDRGMKLFARMFNASTEDSFYEE